MLNLRPNLHSPQKNNPLQRWPDQSFSHKALSVYLVSRQARRGEARPSQSWAQPPRSPDTAPLGDICAIAIPVESVNLAEADLTLFRMTDRNIIRTMHRTFNTV